MLSYENSVTDANHNTDVLYPYYFYGVYDFMLSKYLIIFIGIGRLPL